MKLPNSAKVNKIIPKTQFYSRFAVSNKLKEEFIDKIKKIIWVYKLAENTINISKTSSVEEIQVFEIELKERIIPKNAIKLINKAIPYPILFVFKYGEDMAYGISLKDAGPMENNYYSGWNEVMDFDFTGSNLEKVYQKIIKKFIKKAETEGKEFSVIIETEDKIKIVEAEIMSLKNKLKNEKQFNKKIILNKELKKNQEILNLLQNN